MNAAKTNREFKNKKDKTREKKNKDLFAEVHVVAPAPSRDYCALQLYQKKFLWTRWKISRGPFESPVQKIVPMDEFLKDGTLQNELTYIFGTDTTNLIQDLAHERWSLVSMPSEVIQRILSFITVPDILQLSKVCKRLSKECSKNELWRKICKKEWKILIHNDIEKAGLIGWKRVYLEKMKPKLYKTDTTRPRPNVLQRNRIGSISTLNTPDSRSSTTKSNFTIHKRVQELKKSETLRSTSEIFGKDFKANSTSTGRSTDRTIKGRCSSSRLNSRSSMERKYFQQPFAPVGLLPLAEDPKQPISGKSPRATKCKVTAVRVRPGSSNPIQSTDIQRVSFSPALPRPSMASSVKPIKKNL